MLFLFGGCKGSKTWEQCFYNFFFNLIKTCLVLADQTEFFFQIQYCCFKTSINVIMLYIVHICTIQYVHHLISIILNKQYPYILILCFDLYFVQKKIGMSEVNYSRAVAIFFLFYYFFQTSDTCTPGHFIYCRRIIAFFLLKQLLFRNFPKNEKKI